MKKSTTDNFGVLQVDEWDKNIFPRFIATCQLAAMEALTLLLECKNPEFMSVDDA